jgi:uncharacterized BrkB/YihY/UPF0761 family membrane protein
MAARQCTASRRGTRLLQYTLDLSAVDYCNAVAALAFGRDAAEGGVIAGISGRIEIDGARFIQQMMRSALESKRSGIFATIGGAIALVFGSIGVFSELQGTIDDVWHAPIYHSDFDL